MKTKHLTDSWRRLAADPTDTLIARFGLLVFVTYLMKSGVEGPWLSLPLILGLMLSLLLLPDANRNRWFWLAASGVTLLDILLNYFLMANHHFVLLYFCLLLFFAFSAGEAERDRILAVNGRWVIAGIMFFAAFQKVMAPEYASGGFFGYMTLGGEFFEPLTALFPDIRQVMDANQKVFLQAATAEPAFAEQFALRAPFPHFREFSIFFAYVVALGELLVALAFIFFNNEKWRHLLLIGIIAGVFLTRLETGFLSILCLFGIAQCPPAWTRFRQVYLGLILFFVSLIIVGVGFE